MAFAPIALTIPQYEDFPNQWLKAFEQGTTTPLVMATDATGGTTVAKFQLDSLGFPVTAGSARLIPFINGRYDLWLFPTAAEADANDTSNAIQFADNLNADPLSDTSSITLVFDNVADMQTGTALDGSTVTFSAGQILSTGYGDWQVVTATTKIALTGGFFALPLNGVWADDFSTDGTTFTDVEIQAALVAADSTTGTKLGENTFIINNQVEARTSVNETDIIQPTNSFIGLGKNKTTVINRFAGSWLRHRPTVAQAALLGDTIGARFTGFKLNEMTVTTDGSSPSGAAGAEIYSAWFGESINYDETALKGNGFSIPLDATLNAQPDRYSCGEFRLIGFTSSGGTGIGVNIETPSLTLRMSDFYIITNAMGGVFLPGAAHHITSGTISGNGASNGVNGADGFGLFLAHATGFTQHNVRVQGIELDNNWGRDLIIDGYKNDIDTRIIQNGTLGVGGNTFRATDMIFINSSVSGFAAQNNLNIIARVDSAAGAAINGITTTDSATTEDNVANIRFLFAGGDDVSNVTKANFLGTSRERNVLIEDGHVTAASHQGAIDNTNKVFIKSDASNALDIAAQKISFSSTWDDFGLWSNANDEYTVPHTGLCTVRFSAPFRSIITTDPIFIEIRIDDVLADTIEWQDGIVSTSGSQQLNFTTTVAVTAGEAVQIYGRAGSNDGTFILSSTPAGITIFME
jgi:hypothetical protein